MNLQFIEPEDHSDTLSASLFVIEFKNLMFSPKRAYWLTDFVSGSSRGRHAHKELNQLMIMIKGSLDLLVSDGKAWKTIKMVEKKEYLYIPSGHWREMRNASSDAVLLVLADAAYNEDDYIRNWNQYLEWISSNS